MAHRPGKSLYGAPSTMIVSGVRDRMSVALFTVEAMGERCATCFGPAGPGHRRCYQCEQHWTLAAGQLADVVVPIAYAVRGGPLAVDLWRYKNSGYTAAGAARDMARDRLRTMLLGFLRDHGGCVWRAAGMSHGPDLWAVVPTGRGRGSEHPLTAIAAPHLRPPRVAFAARSGQADRGRDLDPEWLGVRTPVRGRSVLLLEDTWVTGSSAQSAAVALKLAGAGRVAVVVLGRHLDPADPRVVRVLRWVPKPTREVCVVHAGHTGNNAALPTCSGEWVADRLLWVIPCGHE